MKTRLVLVFLMLFVLLTACQLPGGQTPTGTPQIPTDTITPLPATSSPITPSSTPSPSATPTPAGPCTISAPAGVNVYTRPSTSADLFYTTVANDVLPPALARTADGWIGFDPGVAQAANTGPFRLRWLQESLVSLAGGCEQLPVISGPLPGLCYFMPMQAADVHASAFASSQVVLTLMVNDYAEILGNSPDGMWFKVDMARGSPAQSATGWVESSQLNMNGPCDNLPTITP